MNARDAALLRRWSEHRDAEAFNDLVSHHADMVYATCKRILGNPSDAEELTQECFLKLAAGRVRVRTSLGGWLHSAATSLSINRIRSENRRRKREEIAVAAAPASVEPAWDDIQRFVDEAIAELPERLREPVVRHFLQRETHEDIANDLGVSRSTITKRIALGIDRVRQRLRARGVVMTSAAFATLAWGGMAEAAPAALKASLGRLALSGAVQSAAVVTGTTLVAKIAAALVVAATLGTGATIAYHRHETAALVASRQESVAVAPKAVASKTKQAQRDAQPAASAPKVVPASDAGAKTGTISGRVYDDDTRQGIPGAKMYIDCGDIFHMKGETDERGEYRFENVPGAIWNVRCTSANGYCRTAEIEEREKSVRELRLKPGNSTAGIDFALARGEGVAGSAVDAGGRPVAGAKVTAITLVNNLRRDNTSESREDGTFLVTGFPTREGLLYLWAEGKGLVSADNGPIAFPQKDAPLAPLVLRPEAIVRGVVQDKQGKRLAGLTVSASFVPHRDIIAEDVTVVSDANGRFEVRGIPAGEVDLRVQRGREFWQTQGSSLTMAVGQVVDNFVLTCTVTGLSISGQVVDSKGNGLAESMVMCDGTPLRTSGDGKFIVKELEPGTYSLSAMHQKHLNSEPVEVAAGTENVRIVMPDGISVEGRVVNADTGKPIPEFGVKYCVLPEQMTSNDGYEKSGSLDGTFKCAVGLIDRRQGRPEATRIAVRAEGYLLGYADVPMDGPQAVVRDVVIRLKPQADLRGRVHDAKGMPVAGALVFSGKAKWPEDESFASARTGNDGGFALPAQKLGDGFITVYHAALGTGEATLEPKHYAGEPIDVTLPSGTALECTVLANGAPCADAYVHVSSTADPRDNGSLPVRPDGKCRFQSLAPEEYMLSVSLPSSSRGIPSAQQARTVTLTAGQTTEVSVDFAVGDASVVCDTEGGAQPDFISLVVKIAQGEQSYNLHLFDEKQDAGSSYSFSNLPAGEATLTVSWLRHSSRTANNTRRYAFTLTPGATVRQAARLEAGAALWGSVGPVSPGGTGTVRVFYGAVAEDTPSQLVEQDRCSIISVAEDGTFRMEGFQPGTYTLVPQSYTPGDLTAKNVWEAAVTVELGEQGREVTLRLP